MSRAATSLWRLPAIAAGALLLSGCPPDTVRTLTGGIGQAEAFAFKYIRLQPDANRQYALRMNLGSGCRDYLFDKFALADALRTKQFRIPQPPIRDAVFTYAALEGCVTPGEKRLGTDDLAELVLDANGNVTGKKRPQAPGLGTKLVDAGISRAGVVSVLVFGFQFSGSTASGTRTPGPMTGVRIEVPSDQVAGATERYATSSSNAPYVEATLVDVPQDPARINVEFSFIATPMSGGTEVLLAWDGEMVLRTDL